MTATQASVPASQVRVMSALATLNTLRVAAGKQPLRNWKESRAKLNAAIEKAHGDVPLNSPLPNVPAASLIAKINQQGKKPVLDADCNIVKVSQDDRKQAWKDQPPRNPPVLKSIAISKPVTPEIEKIIAANKAQGKKKSTNARARFDWETAEEKAKTGVLATPPDMSAPTHKHYVGKLNEVCTLARAGKLKELQAFKVGDRTDGSPGLVKRYQALAIVALKAKKA